MHFGSNQQIREELIHSISNDYSSIVNDLSKYAKTQNLIVPEKSQEQWIDMLSHGEKVENFLNYIDNFSKSSNPYPHNEFEKMIDFLAPVQKEPVVGKGLADFMTEIYREYHSGSEKNIQNERGQYIEREVQKSGRTGKVEFDKEKYSFEGIAQFGEAVHNETFKLDLTVNIPLKEALESNINRFLMLKSEEFENAVENINTKLGDKAFSLETWKKFEPETVIRLSDAINKYDFRLDTNEPLESNINRFFETYDELKIQFNSEFGKSNVMKGIYDGNNYVNDTIDLIMRAKLEYFNGEPLKESELRTVVDKNTALYFSKVIKMADEYPMYHVEDLYKATINSLKSYLNENSVSPFNLDYSLEDDNLSNMLRDKIDIMAPYVILYDLQLPSDLSTETHSKLVALIKNSRSNSIGISDLYADCIKKNEKLDVFDKYFDAVLKINAKLVRSIEDVLDRSRELGLTLSKNHIEVIRASIEEKKLSVEEHIEQLEKMGARHAEKGYAWHIREDHNPKYPLLYYIDKHNNINCYVVERTNSQTGERFFVANRINENGEHFKITSNNNLDIVKNHVAAYYTGVTIREFSLEMSKSFEKSQQSSPTGTKELELSL
ncbi:MAG: hypothetical protein JXK07_06300 [Spirochaetes bacterium]|nr:hypothetical protein [Spirochaetota bacterium]